MRTALFWLGGAFCLLSFSYGCNREEKKLATECAAFLKYDSESGARAQAAVPMEERPKATTGPDRAAWHRKLAAAYDEESRKPAQFTHPRIADLEARLKKTYVNTAAALRKTADGFEKSDRALVERGQIEDGEATSARQAVTDEAARSCNK
jgi:hypothetical protein